MHCHLPKNVHVFLMLKCIILDNLATSERKLINNYSRCSRARRSLIIWSHSQEKPPLINQQSVVYEFTCDLCGTNYIGYTCRHLHQRIEEHKHFVIGKRFRDAHGLTPNNLIKNFKVIKKCCDKFECLVYEMLWIKNKRPKLNMQVHSICAKLFTRMLSC